MNNSDLYIYKQRMMIEEPNDRIKTQNLYEDLEVKIIDCMFIKVDFLVNWNKRSLGCVLYELAFLQLAHRNKGKEHPSGGSQLFSTTIKRFIILKH